MCGLQPDDVDSDRRKETRDARRWTATIHYRYVMKVYNTAINHVAMQSNIRTAKKSWNYRSRRPFPAKGNWRPFTTISGAMVRDVFYDRETRSNVHGHDLERVLFNILNDFRYLTLRGEKERLLFYPIRADQYLCAIHTK